MEKNIATFEEYKKEYDKSVTNPEVFWEEKARNFIWRRKWDNILSWDFTKAEIKWFEGGKLNITENCLDRHLEKIGNQTAIKWIANNPSEKSKSISYKELHLEVCKFSNVLKNNGAKKGDRICIYMPMVPELAIAVLACARIGAIHSVVFAGFSAKSLSDRINDASCTILITADGSFRGEKVIPLKNISDEAMDSTPSVKRCIVLERTKSKINMQKIRDVWWHNEMKKADEDCSIEMMNSEDPLFILYTSGSTGKPKGIQHSIAGYMIYTEFSFRNVFQYSEGDIYWCTADIGWITGHSYILYGPLLSGATTMMFEGVPSYPDSGRFWKIIEDNNVNIFYTAPTAIRALEAKGMEFVKPYDLSSLKVLGTVGEPINEDAWHWYNKEIGNRNAPIVDTWWQTETGGIMISNLAGVTPGKPTFATLPLPGIQPCLVDEQGNEIKGNSVKGRLCIKYPWPAMARSIYGNHERFKNTYFNAFKNKYFTGDGCLRDENGMYRITGRVDDVLIVSGHNLGTAEIESAIDQHKNVCETAIVGYPHPIKGNGIYAYVICHKKPKNKDALRIEINELLTKEVGPIAKADKILFVSCLPKTRSGKIMRRILRKIAEGETENLGDTSTLLDPAIVEEIKKLVQ
ncbi:MAG: acetate--CoA ligase [Flavobacteriales bacterium]|nr:acetate--CoA ligase [Flavobacteriales bacterium]|tara:strand:+ start:16846 stop:18741 length:1896 start_codon:yes stop_codon:yes gene_type:complete